MIKLLLATKSYVVHVNLDLMFFNNQIQGGCLYKTQESTWLYNNRIHYNGLACGMLELK